MNIGSLYTVKKYFWFLFPSKEKARPARTAAAHFSRLFNCEVTYFSPDSIIIFLENDGKFKKVLTSEGLIGWTWFTETYNECFEEVKREQ